MKGKIERRFVELEATGRTLSAAAVTYNIPAKIKGGEEKFTSGAFSPLPAANSLNLTLQHARNEILGVMEVRSTEKELLVSCELPNTQRANDAIELVKTGALRGLSIEFIALEQRWLNGVRTISKSRLTGCSLVDYPTHLGTEVDIRSKDLEQPQPRRRMLFV